MCTANQPHACTKCLSCRINKSRVWTARLLLEAQSHEHSFFSTFTYEKEPSNGSLDRRHIQTTFHRLRDSVRRELGTSVRFYACGEYGETTERPHYHAAVFGLPPGSESLIDSAWQGLRAADGSEPGHTHHGTLTPESAGYIAGYVTKKLTDDSRRRDDSRAPEFACMSKRPAIGVVALGPLVDALNTSEGALYIARHGDVPTSFSVGGRSLPLGTHIRGLLRSVFFGEHTRPELAKVKANERFHKTQALYLPDLPIDAGPWEAHMAKFLASQEACEAHFSVINQKGRQTAARHKRNNLKAFL